MKVVNNSPLGTNRKNAVIAAVLFIIGTVSGSISAMLYVPLMKAPDFLVKFAANQNLINLAIILQFVMGIACAGISVALYPIIKRYSQSIGYWIGWLPANGEHAPDFTGCLHGYVVIVRKADDWG